VPLPHHARPGGAAVGREPRLDAVVFEERTCSTHVGAPDAHPIEVAVAKSTAGEYRDRVARAILDDRASRSTRLDGLIAGQVTMGWFRCHEDETSHRRRALRCARNELGSTYRRPTISVATKSPYRRRVSVATKSLISPVAVGDLDVLAPILTLSPPILGGKTGQ